MQNYHAVETEAAFRRAEWQREMARATQARPSTKRMRWAQLVR
jgi:hypothetical protein